jgi:hypothetical protein
MQFVMTGEDIDVWTTANSLAELHLCTRKITKRCMLDSHTCGTNRIVSYLTSRPGLATEHLPAIRKPENEKKQI